MRVVKEYVYFCHYMWHWQGTSPRLWGRFGLVKLNINVLYSEVGSNQGVGYVSSTAFTGDRVTADLDKLSSHSILFI